MSECAVIFDMDGVLIDSVSLNWQAMNEVLSRYGVHVQDSQLYRYVGQTLHDQVTKLSDDYNIRLNYDQFLEETDQIKQKLFANITPKEGVKELLHELSTHHIPTAVATSMSRDVTKNRLTTAGIYDLFKSIITEEDVDKHKPDPAVYIKAASVLGCEAARCVVFEDAPTGVQAAKAAGMKCIAVKTPYVAAQHLKLADTVIPSLSATNLKELNSLF